MDHKHVAADPVVSFETHPDRYKHWKLTFEGAIARLSMDVKDHEGLRPDYVLKLNSYDLGVDIELADAVQRIRFEHPEVKAVVVGSAKDRVFCSGANIFMLGSSTHGFKVNFCKFTNETRLGLEDASANSGLKFLCAVNGPCAGGGYELALACDEIILVDDGSSSVSLPEVPLLGVLPGTGGLTRVVDKRKVRRDLADAFSTVSEGIKGKRAVEWRLVDQVVPRSKFDAAVTERAGVLAEQSDRPGGAGVRLTPLEPRATATALDYKYVSVKVDAAQRVAQLTVRSPDGAQPTDPASLQAAGAEAWVLRAFRELDDALLRLRFMFPEIGTVTLHTQGAADAVLAADAMLEKHASHWLVREVRHFQKRVLKRLDLTAKTFYALVEPGSCFAGVLAELLWAADRAYMLDSPDDKVEIALGSANAGPHLMSNGLTRLETRFLGTPKAVSNALAHKGPFDAQAALEAGLVTFAPDDIDWEDEVRIALSERASFSPDALTGMEANLRFAGPETMETKIFGRLSAWQNWIFIRPSSTGEKGALSLYGKSGIRPEFDLRRT
jgi:benzoyl-CoA-dihydrodiol lyase